MFRLLRESDFGRLCVETIGAIAVLTAIGAFVYDLSQREEDRIVRAWNIVAQSPSAKGNIGQKDAVELLVRKDIPLDGVNLRWAHLVNAEIPGAELWNSRLELAELEGANLQDAVLMIARLNGAVLRRADLRRANLRAAQFGPAYLRPNGVIVALIGLPLSAVPADATLLRGTDLREADLRGADLRGAVLIGADLTGANLSGADLRSFEIEPGEWRETIVSRYELKKACADLDNPPKLEATPKFAGLKLAPCS